MKTKLLFLLIMTVSLVMNAQHETYWETYNAGLPVENSYITDIDVVDDNIIWGAMRDNDNPYLGFVRTIDGGATWVGGNIIPGNTTSEIAMIHAISADICWAAIFDPGNAAQGIYKTIDGGATWTQQTSAAFNHAASFPNVVHFWDENVGFCQGDAYGGTHECYTTTDGGANWTEVTGMPPVLAADEYGTVGFYTVLDDTLWYTTTSGRIFRSYDFGNTFEVFQSDIGDSQIELAFKNQQDGYLSGPDGVFFKTSDGGETWNIHFPDVTPFNTADLYAFPGTDIVMQTGSTTGSFGALISEDGFDTLQILCDDSHTCIDAFGTTAIWTGGFAGGNLDGGLYKYIGPEPGIGVNDISEIDGLKAYPNPVQDVLNMSAQNEISNVQIFNMLGQKVLTQEVNALTAKINTANLANGTYIVQITIGDVVGSMKIIK